MPIEKPKTTQPQTQIPISNQFQALENISKPSQIFVQAAQILKLTSCNHISKAHLMKIHILESHHISKIGSIDLVFNIFFILPTGQENAKKFEGEDKPLKHRVQNNWTE